MVWRQVRVALLTKPGRVQTQAKADRLIILSSFFVKILERHMGVTNLFLYTLTSIFTNHGEKPPLARIED